MENNNNATQNNSIDLLRLWRLFKQHILSVIIWTVGLGIIGFALSEFVIQPKYSSSAQILVNQKKDRDPNALYNAQQADVQMINTYKDIITSPVILNDASDYLANPVKVVKKAQKAKYVVGADGVRRRVRAAKPAVTERDGQSYDYSAKELNKAVSVQTQQNSQVFTLTATAVTPDQSKAIANAVANSFKNKIPKIMNVNNVTIVSRATKGIKSFPNTKLFTLAGLVLGFIIALAIIITRDAMNTTVRDDDYLSNELGLTNLGTVTHFALSNSFSLNKDKDKGNRRNKRV
ncbi:Wzz/FepE/Etk N-terminal domain-containing protein [Lactobacillus rodentium]|uniref:Capsular polysaccharide biosynthesis protein CpsC n=1 Tax=Lactobacillus rodentium TaxID=947835 RepID=A0A2Z6TG02_9LACO|nr:Wzz/FepE/Etk N-terminal domain-containing protein [Lactobacillus rodentium]MCR1894767.1 Wzz/FepE/Etk N-terminal domain-containing protein [Lactobacillus rodentium]GBG04982.1 exopolysaccharide biosynthesis protein [Lactobacillus rodentium]